MGIEAVAETQYRHEGGMDNGQQVFIVDDDPGVRDSMRALLAVAGFTVAS
jgi:hypothetical protein